MEKKETVEKKRRSRRWIVLAIVVIILAIPFIAWSIWSHSTRRALTAEIERLRAAGERIDLEDWIPPPIPEAEDSTPILREAFAAYDAAQAALEAADPNGASADDGLPLLKDWAELLRKEAWKVEDVSLAREVLRQHAETLAALRRIPPRPRVSFKWDYDRGFWMLLPELDGLRGCTRLAALAARVHAEDGDYEQMVRDIQAALRVASAPDSDHVLIVHLVRIACADIAVVNLVTILRDHNVPPQLLAELDADLVNARRGIDFQSAMECERAFGLYMLLELSSVDLNALCSTLGCSEVEKVTHLDGLLWRATAPMCRRNALHYLRKMGEVIEAAQDYSWRVCENIAELSASLEKEKHADTNSFGMYSPLEVCLEARRDPVLFLIPGFLTGLRSHVDNDSRVDSMRIAIALRRYRAENGELAASLEHLVPKFLPELPLDPYTGKNFLIKREDGTVTVYSVGHNLKDDAAQIEEDKKSGTYPDVGVRIREEFSEEPEDGN